MATVIKNLQVAAGSLSLPDKTIPFWGFANAFFGSPQTPGPLIEATVGDRLTIRLIHNNSFARIGEPISIIFPGQENVMVRKIPSGPLIPQPVQPQYAGGKMISLTNYLDENVDWLIEYSFTATKPGIYLYESGTNPEKQIQMGVYGVIVIRPSGYNTPDHPNYKTAYGAGTGSDYDVERILVIGEIDSIMHNDVEPGVYYDMLKFKPDYWVINGRSFPDTLAGDNNTSQPYGSKISCKVGQRVLLRVINAGFQNHTFYLGGFVGRVVAADSFPLMTPTLDATYEKTGVTLGSGQSFDIVFTPTTPGDFYLYDREYHHLVNNNQFPGGMMTKIEVTT
ncbi:MAG: ferroxidase [Peptococcaceae bacterium]|nr:ferroxidase [Peptococcaceae bacterium]